MLNADEQDLVGKVERLMRTDDAKALLTLIDGQVHRAINSLKTSGDLIAVARYQGKLEILDWLLKFRG